MKRLPLTTGSATELSLTDWLDVLRAVFPPCGVLLVGAGAGNGNWVQWLRSRHIASADVPVYLVEGDEHHYRNLQRTLGAEDGWVSWRDVVAPEAGSVAFYRVSNPAENGLLPVQALQGLWPNLEAVQELPIEAATTLDGLRSEGGGAINWLILDCLPAAALLQGGGELLSQLDMVLARVAGGVPSQYLADRDAVDQVLQAAGMRPVHSHEGRHPAVAHVLYVRDAATRLEEFRKRQDEAERARNLAAESERQAATQALQELQDKFRQAQLDLKQKHEQIGNMQEAWANEKMELERARLAERESARDASDQLRTELEQQFEQARLKQWGSLAKDFSEMEKRLRASLDKGLANSVKQIENFISIQNYLSTGDGLTNFHGWPISPDIGLFLIERIRERRHDLIIEFGSGTSTALFAKVLRLSPPEKSPRGSRSSDIGTEVKSPSRGFRPVCTFEHDKLYLQKTQALLEAHGLLDLVALHHAPLVDWQDESGQYLYYDCDAVLAALAKKLGRRPKRVLVLVDGPPGATCDKARYPAVPLIFRHFSTHQVDVVLDDANRVEEKSVIELWRTLWSMRSIKVTETIIPSEKGLYWVRNYGDVTT